ncbi:hypothetical protein QFC20_002717 [Naganishia adeliensis]|uniref:Uncharacterized protein n=1 Tax=Naganishia adeliensis TaxID=92952 RepID=A0ACC2WJF3_9TREE|nr:hypothetical protein QFC20_002717 [Naganishia adeliensis]
MADKARGNRPRAKGSAGAGPAMNQENQDPTAQSEVAKLQASLATARQDFNTALAEIRKDVLSMQNAPAAPTPAEDGPGFEEKVKTANSAQTDVKL